MIQLTTKTGKPIINRNTLIPLNSKPIDYRIKQLKNELGYQNKSQSERFEDKWNAICNEFNKLNK